MVLATLAAQAMTHQALATSPVGIADLPPTKGNLVVSDPTEEPATKQATIEQVSKAIASPESLMEQEFASRALPASESPSTQRDRHTETVVVPTVASPAPPAPSSDIAPPETEITLASTPVEKKACMAKATATKEQTPILVAQGQPTNSCLEVEDLKSQLRDVENIKDKAKFEALPALSINIPTGFGADRNTAFISGTYQERTRYGNKSDGALGVGVGLGNADKAVGVELSYTAASFGGSRDFGSGGFNVKVHRKLKDDLSVAAGWNGFLNLGGENDFENSVYGTVTKIFRTRDDINLPLSRIAVTAGVGNGQFRTEDALAKDAGGVNVFGNVAVRVAKPVSLIAEWSGQDLGVGVSIAPFKNIPLVITPAVRDIVGAGDGARFVLGTGLAWKF